MIYLSYNARADPHANSSHLGDVSLYKRFSHRRLRVSATSWQGPIPHTFSERTRAAFQRQPGRDTGLVDWNVRFTDAERVDHFGNTRQAEPHQIEAGLAPGDGSGSGVASGEGAGYRPAEGGAGQGVLEKSVNSREPHGSRILIQQLQTLTEFFAVSGFVHWLPHGPVPEDGEEPVPRWAREALEPATDTTAAGVAGKL